MDDPMDNIIHGQDSSIEVQKETAVEELQNVFGHQVTKEELVEVLLASNCDLNSSISALIQRGYRQLPGNKFENRQGNFGSVEYCLPESYCYESAFSFNSCTCERLPLNRMIKDWYNEIMRKRGTEKKKKTLIPEVRSRNDSQCSGDSMATVSMDSREIGESSQDLSEDSQDIVVDSFEMETETEFENTSTRASTKDMSSQVNNLPQNKDTQTLSCKANSKNSAFKAEGFIKNPTLPPSKHCEVMSKAITMKPETEYNFSFSSGNAGSSTYSGPTLASLIKSQSESTRPYFSYSPKSQGSTGPSLSALAQSHLIGDSSQIEVPLQEQTSGITQLGNSGLNIPSLPQPSTTESFPSLSCLPHSGIGFHNLDSSHSGLERNEVNLSSLAQSSLGGTGPNPLSLNQSTLGNAGLSLSGLAQSSLGSNESNLSSLAQSTIGSNGPNLSSLAQSNLGSVGPNLSSLAQSSLGNTGFNLPSLVQSSIGSTGHNLSSFPQSSLENTGPSLSNLAQSTLASTGPNLSSLAHSSLENTGPSLSNLAQSTLASNGPNLSSLAQSSLENTGPSLTNLAQSTLASTGPNLSSLAQSSLENTGPSLSNLAQSSLAGTGTNLSSLAQSSLGSIGPKLSDLAQSTLGNKGSSLSNLAQFSFGGTGLSLESGMPSLSNKAQSHLAFDIPLLTGSPKSENIFSQQSFTDHNNTQLNMPKGPVDDVINLAKENLCSVSHVMPSIKELKLSDKELCVSHTPVDASTATLNIPSNHSNLPSRLSVPPGFSPLPGIQTIGLDPPGLRLPPGLNISPSKKSVQSNVNNIEHNQKEAECLELIFDLEGDGNDMNFEIDLQTALVKHSEGKAEIKPEDEAAYNMFIDPYPRECDMSLIKGSPSAFGEVITMMPPLPPVNKLAEKIFSVPFEIFKFDTPSPDELVRKALEDHNNPDWYRILTRERQSRR